MRRRRLLAEALRSLPPLRVALRLALRLLTPRRRVGVMAVLVDPRGRVLLARHVAHPGRPWGLPGGWLAGRETPETGLARELREELRIEARVGPLLLAEQLDAANSGGVDGLALLFACEVEGEAPASFDPRALAWELLDARWFAPGEPWPPLGDLERRAIHVAVGRAAGRSDGG
jgi:ADP-ribose pyrophosphatase YjhB (NUDIX family)